MRQFIFHRCQIQVGLLQSFPNSSAAKPGAIIQGRIAHAPVSQPPKPPPGSQLSERRSIPGLDARVFIDTEKTVDRLVDTACGVIQSPILCSKHRIDHARPRR